jgi:hypothetical protein
MDEYDVPIQQGYLHDYYNDVVEFMRNLLSAAFKDNSFIQKGIITGNLRVAKESIFTGMNNLRVYTLLSEQYSDSFGFSEHELMQILKDTNQEDKLNDIKQWYDGYVFGKKHVYNPWSILNYVSSPEDGLKPYWVNTSSNDLIRKLIIDKGFGLQGDMENLLKDIPVEKQIDESINFRDLESMDNAVFSLMLFAGYLKHIGCEKREETDYCKLLIPNNEVKYIFKRFFSDWMSQGFQTSNKIASFMKALVSGNDEDVEGLLSDFVMNSLSYLDIKTDEVPEQVYKAFVIGLFVTMNEHYIIESEPESGYGRADVLIIPRQKSKTGVVLEFKKLNKRRNETVERAFERARNQIEERQYEQKVREHGVKHVLKYGVIFDGKQVWVKKYE